MVPSSQCCDHIIYCFLCIFHYSESAVGSIKIFDFSLLDLLCLVFAEDGCVSHCTLKLCLEVHKDTEMEYLFEILLNFLQVFHSIKILLWKFYGQKEQHMYNTQSLTPEPNSDWKYNF